MGLSQVTTQQQELMFDEDVWVSELLHLPLPNDASVENNTGRTKTKITVFIQPFFQLWETMSYIELAQ